VRLRNPFEEERRISDRRIIVYLREAQRGRMEGDLSVGCGSPIRLVRIQAEAAANPPCNRLLAYI